MKLKELPGIFDLRKLTEENGTRRLIIRAAVIAAGILFSRAQIFGQYCPFGVSLAAAVPFPHVFFAFIGSSVGYIVFPAASASFR